MGVAYNSRITTDGLVLCLDAANTKSYPGILDNIVGWRLPSTNYIRGTLLDNDRTWSSEPSTGYSSVILNKTFNAGENFEVIAYWARDYRGIGMVYGPNVSIFDFTGYSVDGYGPYFGALSTSGFPSGYSAAFFGQYHSPIAGQGAQTTGYWFKWARTGNTLSLQYSATSSSGPWTNILADVSINSTDKVIIGAGEASSNEVSDLSLISVGPGPYTWTDLSTNGNTGTLVNGVGYSASNGGALSFDGSNDYVDCGKTATQLGVYDADYTFDAWVYPTNLDSDKTMFGTDQTASRQGLHLVFRGGAIYQGHYGADFSAGSATLNAWNNISYTYVKSSSSASIYKNGVLQGSGSIASFIGTTNILIGRWASNYYFSGNGSNYKIYNRALTAAEISQNFNALRGRFGI